PAATTAAAATSAPAPTTMPAAQATTAPATAAGGRTLKLGVLLPYSKVYAALGESITNGMQLYFDSIGGASGGRRIEMIKEDEENDPPTASRKYRKLVEQDQVDLTTGIVSTAVLYAVRDYAHENKILLVCSNAGGDALAGKQKSPYIFRTSFANSQPSLPMGQYVYDKIAKRVVTCAADYGAGRESMGAFKDGFTRAGGTLLAEVWPPFPNTDYAPFLEQVRQARPEAVYSFFAGSDAVNFVKQFDEFGLKKDIKLTGSGFMLEEDVFPAQAQAALGGITGLHYATTLDNPENARFKDEYTRNFGKPADVYAVQGWDTARFIDEALKKVQGNTTDKDALVKAMEAIAFESPRGPWKMDAETHNPIFNVYAREVRLDAGKPTNFVVETFKDVRFAPPPG
ncbi:MAG: ABC transporter substrate-binding protein, partial [Chloroflexota bacterium]|nr:ABC transporter substrate-binding protein [Chloroflexota bacterium]